MGQVAYKCHELERDATPVASVAIECPLCDPDNPRGVSRPTCPRCGGTGLAHPSIADVVAEIRQSRLELLVGGKA
jgi:hypothetical protein